MAFKVIGSLNPHGAPVKKRLSIANSVASVVLDSLKVSSGFLALGTAGSLVFGHLLSHTTELGMGMETTGVAGAQSGSYVGAFTAASDNQTVAKVKGECDVSKYTLYSAEESAAIGTTTGSNLAGYTQDLTDEDTLNEGSALTTTGQYMGWGVDPNRTSHAVVNIFESQVFGV